MLFSNSFTVAAASATPATTTQGVAPVNEVQELAVAAATGTFTVTYAGQTTAAVAFDVAAADLQTALIALSNLAPGDVVVTGGPGDALGTTPYVLTYGGTLAGTNVAQITASATGLGGGTATPSTTTAGVAAVNEVQTVTFEATSGPFTVTFDGDTTDPVDYSTDLAADLEAALFDIASVGEDNVTVAFNPTTGVATITFVGDLAAAPQPEVTVDDGDLIDAVQINDELVEATEFTVHTTDVIRIGGTECEFLVPQDFPVEVEYSLGEPVYAAGTGTIYTLYTGCQKTPVR